MSNLIPTRNSTVTRRPSVITGRALARLDNQTELGIAEIEAKAELQVTRVMAVGYVGKKAMQEVALISQLEQQLSTLVPLATSRLQAIGDITALSAAEIVSDTVRKVNR